MKHLLLIGICGFLVACGQDSNVGFSNNIPEGCTQEEVAGGSNITCGDETVFIADGKKGSDGSDGADGSMGDKGDKGDKGDTGLTGARGDQGPRGLQGLAGVNGSDGADGKDGKDGVNGKDGDDGVNGKDGDDAVIYSSVKVNKNTCTQVYKDIWVENINEGGAFDVYYNPNCADAQGEYCDNVRPSYGVHGSIDENHGRGSGTTCWADNVEIQGHKGSKDATAIIIKIKDFN